MTGEIWPPRVWLLSVIIHTEYPKIYRKSVLHLLKYEFAVYIKQMQYIFAVNFGTLSSSINNGRQSRHWTWLLSSFVRIDIKKSSEFASQIYLTCLYDLIITDKTLSKLIIALFWYNNSCYSISLVNFSTTTAPSSWSTSWCTWTFSSLSSSPWNAP